MWQSKRAVAFVLAAVSIITGCSGSSSGANDLGRGDSCGIHQSRQSNGEAVAADVREAICETSAGFLAPDVASMFVFVHGATISDAPDNIALRYEVVCPEEGDCNYRAPKVKWLTQSALRITIETPGDVYCVQRSEVNGVTILYSSTALRNPPQDSFTTLGGLCE